MKRQKRRVTEAPSNSKATSYNATTSTIAGDPNLGYKIRVILYDMQKVSEDPNSERRINSTVDEHYVSLPYFNDSEAHVIKSATVDVNPTQHNQILNGKWNSFDDNSEDYSVLKLHGQTFETAIHSLLNTFFDKRRASGDARPCGPHHLAPLYASLFGIQMGEIEDSKFLSRLRKCGLS